MATNTGVSTGVAKSGDQSWSSYWTPLKPLGGETPSVWFTSRDKLTLVDSLGGAAAAIQTPYLYKPVGNEYAYVADNGALDIGVSSFTLFAKIKAETVTNANYYL